MYKYNKGVSMYYEPIETYGYYPFYDIPFFSNYAISICGQVLNKEKGTLLNGSYNTVGYHNFRLTNDCGITETLGLHRLLCYVFKHPMCDITNLEVNHKNGIKNDNRLNNLEWVTHRENLEHAGLNGLTDKCSPMSVRDVDTGVILKFPSIVECARYYNVSKDYINYRTKVGETRVFPERKQYRLSHSDHPWYIPEDINVSLKYNGSSKNILARNVLTNKIVEYEQIKDLSEEINVPNSTLSVWLSKENQPVLPGYIQLKYATDTTPWREIGDPLFELSSFGCKKPVVVTNSKTGEITIFNSANECANAMNIKPTALNYRLKTNGSVIFSDGYKYNYYSI